MATSVDVLMPDGRMLALGFRNFDTIKDLLDQLTANEKPEDRRRFSLLEFRRTGDDIDLERPIESSLNVEQLKAEWAKDKFYTSCLKLVKLEFAVVVNYSVAFRMSTGMPEANSTFYVTKDTTIAHLLAEVKSYLKIPKSDNKYGIMGYMAGEKEMRRLSNDEKAYSLKTAWDTNNTFFQFQVLPEAENQLRLGADKESYVEQSAGMTTRRRWASLRGTSMFLFREKGETEPIEEIDNVYKRPITIQGAGKKKGLGLGQKFNYRFDIEYDGKVEAFFVEDEATMRSWVECMKESQARRDARNAAAIAASGKQRTLVQIGSKQAASAAGLAVKEEPKKEPEIPNAQKVNMLLEDVKRKGDVLVEKRDVDATKNMMAAIQNLVQKVGAMVNSSFSEFKRTQVDKYLNDVKARMKDMVVDAKGCAVRGRFLAVSQQAATTNANMITPELRKLKATIGLLYTSCEHLAMSVNMEDADLRILLGEAKPAAPVVQPKMAVKTTGNSALDNAMSSLSMIGVDPELAELMRQANEQTMAEESDSQAKAKQYAYYPGGGDTDLDSMLASLNSSLGTLDGMDPSKPATPAKPSVTERTDSAMTPNPMSMYGPVETCGACYLAIDSGTSIALNGKQFHQRCYNCCVCGARFKPTERVHDTVKGLMCEVDYSSSLPPCAVCLRGVPEEDALLVAGKYFHRSCFKCQICFKPVVGDVYEDKGSVQCENCFFKARDLICVECTRPIKTEYVQFTNKKRHVECFNCSFCRKRITANNAMMQKNKLYCLDCGSKLHG